MTESKQWYITILVIQISHFYVSITNTSLRRKVLWFWYQAPPCPLGFLSWVLVVRLPQGWLGLGHLKSIVNTSYIPSFPYIYHKVKWIFTNEPLKCYPTYNMMKIMTLRVKDDRVLNHKSNVQKKEWKYWIIFSYLWHIQNFQSEIF